MAKLSGGLNNYYVVLIKNPQRVEQEPYQAECEDIIQALGMTFDEGCAFKAIWRNAAARMGNGKPGNTAVYDAEKLVHYANRILAKEKLASELFPDPATNVNTVDSYWHHTSNGKPHFTKEFSFIEIVYKDERDEIYSYNFNQLSEIKWNWVHRYRITY